MPGFISQVFVKSNMDNRQGSLKFPTTAIAENDLICLIKPCLKNIMEMFKTTVVVCGYNYACLTHTYPLCILAISMSNQ